jgi:hypothetical protein
MRSTPFGGNIDCSEIAERIFQEGGAVRPGLKFTTDSPSDAAEADQHVTLEEIYRYGTRVDFIDPPHNAKVVFSGPGVTFLARGSHAGFRRAKIPRASKRHRYTAW